MSEIEDLLRAGGAQAPDAPGPLCAPALKVPPNLVDVAYTVEDSPVGRLLLASTRQGVVRVAYLDGIEAPARQRSDDVLAELAERISPRVLEQSASLDPLRRELDEFFAGKRQEFDLKLDWRLTRGFAQAVLKATAQVPYGHLTSYKGVATAAGSPRAYRAAGNALGSNPLAIIVPCHRVLHTGGGIGGYTGGLERKLTLLGIEGFEA